MNSSSSSSYTDPFYPVLLLAISLIILIGWQISNLRDQRQMMEDASLHQDQMVQQSHQAQAALQKIASDLLELSQTDDTAKTIINKYGISMNGRGGAAAAASTP